MAVDTPETAAAAARAWRPPSWTLPAIAGVLIVAAPWIGVPSTSLRQLTLIAIFTMVVTGINLSFGFAGELALGHVAMFAAGAYTAGMMAKGGWELWATLPAAALAAAVIGLASGVPGLRLGGWGLAMASFFLVVLVPDVVNLLKDHTGGLIGLQGIPRAEFAGHTFTSNQLYLLITCSLVVVIALVRNLVLSRHGAALLVLRQSPVLAGSLGINVFRLKTLAYVLGAVPAGLAGALFVYLDRFIAPDYFGFDLAIALIAASVLGGSASVYGAFFGAALLQLGPMRSTVFDKYALVAYGAFLVLGGVFFSGGAAGLFGRFTRALVARRRAAGGARAATSKAAREVRPLTGERLEVDHVTMDFGGLRALNELSLTAEPGKITGLIGPNGCGKTTLLNVISGFYAPTSGGIRLGGRPLPSGRAHRAARAGIGRTFQTPLIPSSMTTLEVVMAARYTSDYVGIVSAMLRLPKHRRQSRIDRVVATNALALLEIEHLADEPAAELPLGSRRLVEVARALAMEPHILLLDEPAAGLDEAEVANLSAAIRRIRDAGATVVLVEHNFRMVCDVADHIFVLESGRALIDGPPDVVQHDDAVRRIYLGVADDETAPALDPDADPTTPGPDEVPV